MIETKLLTAHIDQRGYFQEVYKFSDPFFSPGVKQASESKMYQGTIKAWHIHEKQYDWWRITQGVALAVVVRITEDIDVINALDSYEIARAKATDQFTQGQYHEFLLGDGQPPQIIKIPPGWAHGVKVLQGPCVLSYFTSREYDPDDEGRIAWDSLDYDWDKRIIK